MNVSTSTPLCAIIFLSLIDDVVIRTGCSQQHGQLSAAVIVPCRCGRVVCAGVRIGKKRCDHVFHRSTFAGQCSSLKIIEADQGVVTVVVVVYRRICATFWCLESRSVDVPVIIDNESVLVKSLHHLSPENQRLPESAGTVDVRTINWLSLLSHLWHENCIFPVIGGCMFVHLCYLCLSDWRRVSV